MKRAIIAAVLITITTAASAQQSNITSTRSGSTGGFSIAPRYSNYATDIELRGVKIDTGRQSSFGLMGDYRYGNLVVDFMFDHDPENGVSISDILPFEFDDYQRDRGEVLVGVSILPQLDLSGGVRMDQVSIGNGIFSNNNFIESADFEHQALAAGLKLHTTADRPVGAWLAARGYIGTAKFDDTSFGDPDTDTTGYRAEVGVSIPLGASNWSLAPALEYERLDTDNDRVSLETNRVMLNFVYRAR